MNEKAKKTVKIVVDVVLWAFLVLAVVMTIFAFTAQASGAGFPKLGNKCFLTVLTESMTIHKDENGVVNKGFNKGDLIICETLDDEQKQNLAVGDVITFYMDLTPDNGLDDKVLNSHRIIEVGKNKADDVVYYTMGDNNPTRDDNPVEWDDVVAQWKGRRIPVLGAIIGFLQSSTGFLICIVLPLLLFFIYEVYLLISTILKIKNKGKRQITAADEELIKQRAVEEYLRMQAAQNAGNSEEAPAVKNEESDPEKKD